MNKEKLEKKVLVWGKDDKGNLLCPVIYLWKSKKGVMKADNLGGALKHGSEVEIIKRDPNGWVYVETEIEHEGKMYPQKGFVKKSLIKEMNIK